MFDLVWCRDKCDNLGSWWCMSGIERTDGTKKPGYSALRDALALKIGS